MDLEKLQQFLGWCALINYAVLLLWAGLFLFARPFLRQLTERVMRVEFNSFDALHYAGISLYKILTIMFFAIPWVALKIICCQG